MDSIKAVEVVVLVASTDVVGVAVVLAATLLAEAIAVSTYTYTHKAIIIELIARLYKN